MKKLLCLMLVIVMASYSFFGCGSDESLKAYTSIDQLESDGFTCTASQFDSVYWKGVYHDQENGYVLVRVRLTDNQVEEMQMQDVLADDYYEACQGIALKSNEIEFKNISDHFPIPEDEGSKYVGQPLQKLVDDGYVCFDYRSDEQEMTFCGLYYSIVCEVSETAMFVEWTNLTEDELLADVVSVKEVTPSPEMLFFYED